ncbi:MAG TPA: alpha/beta fold hydrolase [Candidatus Binatia bacterium]|jgi:3-oxoadipate enol-lactonase|nr:alpha/beta fold hydrolase [Candidatus Binatia bacterium]
MPFLEIGRVVHHYLIEGLENGPALVFSNSLGTDLRIWDAVAGRFRQNFRIVRYDKRGHGLTDSPSPPYIFDDYVRDLAGLLDHLAIHDAVVCGVSIGGMIAQARRRHIPSLSARLFCATPPRRSVRLACGKSVLKPLRQPDLENGRPAYGALVHSEVPAEPRCGTPRLC